MMAILEHSSKCIHITYNCYLTYSDGKSGYLCSAGEKACRNVQAVASDGAGWPQVARVQLSSLRSSQGLAPPTPHPGAAPSASSLQASSPQGTLAAEEGTLTHSTGCLRAFPATPRGGNVSSCGLVPLILFPQLVSGTLLYPFFFLSPAFYLSLFSCSFFLLALCHCLIKSGP